ncbi:MAG: NAD(P)/FAD-dependent oxidoreductase [Candidatus Omnitrophica bacterium]|nr:NAD(P)/FAD-dependent oxidoreductase [Candidatus Omnitrophota bacterium]
MSEQKKQYDVVIIGAGAAGLMCAMQAGQRGRSVLLLEHNDKVGKKIRISGGGRCNFTNVYAGSAQYLSGNSDFARSALSRYTPQDFIQLVQKNHIRFHEKKLGQLFCDESAQQIIDMLLKECAAVKVKIQLNTRVKEVVKTDKFLVHTDQGSILCQSLVVATGGLSIPPLGVSDFGYKLADQFGIKLRPRLPGLVPLTLSKADLAHFAALSGLSFDADVSVPEIRFRENLLFTHRGLSGPAVLQISSYWNKNQPILVDLLPNKKDKLFKSSSSSRITLKNFLANHLPKRFTEVFCELYLDNKPLNQYSVKELTEIEQRLHRWDIYPAGTEGYSKAEVTLGGIDTDELSSKTMESHKVKGLYFIGEVVDVTGHLGGYNFQWAWSSGHAAAQFV